MQFLQFYFFLVLFPQKTLFFSVTLAISGHLHIDHLTLLFDKLDCFGMELKSLTVQMSGSGTCAANVTGVSWTYGYITL